jgi:RNA polymerase sigma-70 factor (ECF subfamily)
MTTVPNEVWNEHRGDLCAVAERMLGDRSEAEDIVQEAFIRLYRVDVSEIEDVRAWLLTVVSRLCLDQLRSARRRRQQPLDGQADEPSPIDQIASAAAVDPADRVTLDDSVRLALQSVLERLSPAERTAFVLHDVFQLSFDDVGHIVGRSPDACRQLASRARRHLSSESDPARFVVGTTEQHDVTQAFIHAASTGDLEGLLSVLDPRVTGEVDLGGGRRGGAGRKDREGIAHGILRFLGPDSGVTLLALPTGPQPSILAIRDGRAYAMFTMTVRGGRIEHFHGVVDPARLDSIAAVLREAW